MSWKYIYEFELQMSGYVIPCKGKWFPQGQINKYFENLKPGEVRPWVKVYPIGDLLAPGQS